MGWFLMLVLAELTNRFGRVSLMATIGAFATRMLRYTAVLYVWTVGLGYALGGWHSMPSSSSLVRPP